jgi:hypothetical protein
MATIHPQQPANIDVTVSAPTKPVSITSGEVPAATATTTTTTVKTSVPTFAEAQTDAALLPTTATPNESSGGGVTRRTDDIVQQVKQALGSAKSRVSTAVQTLPASASAVTESTKASAQSALDGTKTRLENVVQSLPHPPNASEAIASVKAHLPTAPSPADAMASVKAHLPTSESLPSASGAVASVKAHLPTTEGLPTASEAIASAKARLSDLSASLPDTQSVKAHLNDMTASLPSRDAFAHPADTLASARARLPSVEQLYPTQAYSIVTTRLNDAKDRVICTIEENPTVQQVKTKYNSTKARIAENPQVTALMHRAEVAKEQVLARVLKDNDPKHTKETVHIVAQAYADMTTWFGKAMFLLVTLAHFLVLGLPDMMLQKLGVRNNKKFHLKQVVTTPKIWVGEYKMPVATSNCVVFQGLDDTLLIRSPPEPTPAVVQAIRSEGEPAAFLVSLSHDTFVDKWKELFPSALVICPEADVTSVENRCKVDLTLEDAAEYLSTNFRVVQTISTVDWSRTEDYVLILELEPGKLAASLGCGFRNAPPDVASPLFWRNLMLGRQGLGIQSAYAYIFVKDQDKAQEMWNKLREMKGLETLLFLHGDPIVAKPEGEMNKIMSMVNLRRMRWGV